MLLLFSRITLAVALAVVVQRVHGTEYQIKICANQLSDDEDFLTSTSGEVDIAQFKDDSPACCVYGNCCCSSFHNAVTYLTSNVVINITTDVILTLPIKVTNLENVSLIGHNNPTVNCQMFGQIHFTFCRNCIIQGIVWDKCGGRSVLEYHTPTLRLDYSSNVIIQNCTFQHSIGQAVVLSEVSGNVDINHCTFVRNNNFTGHGAVIHHSSNNMTLYCQLVFTIDHCNFTHNGYAESLLYTENTSLKSACINGLNGLTLANSKFSHNQGVSVYAINQTFVLNGDLVFHNNRDTGIYIRDHSTVTFGKNTVAAFSNGIGRTIWLTDLSSITFDQNSIVTFTGNEATDGTIYSQGNCNLTFTGTSKVTFFNNSAERFGAAIFSHRNCHVTFTETCEVTFSTNSAIKYDTAVIYSTHNSHITFTGNSKVKFNNNIILPWRWFSSGALFSQTNCTVTFKGNSNTVFINNTGGAMRSRSYVRISFEENSSTVFSNNTAVRGGAIFLDNNCYISFEGRSKTMFNGNTAREVGGAISLFKNNISPNAGGVTDLDIFFKDNSSAVFSNNTAIRGGAIYTQSNVYLSFEDESKTLFSSNAADLGGAIHTRYNGIIIFKGNCNTVFVNNTAYDGGAIDSQPYSKVSFEDNSTVLFSYNMAINFGGSIHSTYYSKVCIGGDSNTTFMHNTAGNGGAVHSHEHGNVIFEEHSVTVFSNNMAEYGGAVSFNDDCNLTFANNSAVMFTNNKARFGEVIYCITQSKVIIKGNSVVLVNHYPARWCNNSCLPYTAGQGDVVIVDSSGIIWCSDQKGFICLSWKCQCEHLEDILDETDATITELYITSNIIVLSSVMELPNNNIISITGFNYNTTVICINGGRLMSETRSKQLTIAGLSWVGCGGIDTNNIHQPVIGIHGTYVNVTIQNCSFQRSMGKAVELSGGNMHVKITHCNFVNNINYRGHGIAIHYSVADSNTINISNSNFSYNEGADSVIYFTSDRDHSLIGEINRDYGYARIDLYVHINNNCNFYSNQGSSIYLSRRLTNVNIDVRIQFSGEISFENNVAESGAGIYIRLLKKLKI